MLPEIKFEKLPGIPRIWNDFLRSKLSFRPASQQIHALDDHLNTIQRNAQRREDVLASVSGGRITDPGKMPENFRRLGAPGSVVVLTNFYMNILGGPAFQFWKCLTAIKVCAEMDTRRISAVPVCWMNSEPPYKFSHNSVRLLDPESEVHSLRLPIDEAMAFSPEVKLQQKQVSELFAHMEDIGKGTFDVEFLEILRTTFDPETTWSSATARLIARMIEELGMVVLDPRAPEFRPIMVDALNRIRGRCGETESLLKKQVGELAAAGYAGETSIGSVHTDLIQSLVLPIAVCILDPLEVFSYAASLPVFKEIGLAKPLAWPQSSITIMDARSRRILERYDLDIHQLFDGEENTISKISGESSDVATERLDNLISEVEAAMEAINLPDPPGEKFAKSVHDCRVKIIYQLEKLRKHRTDAGMRKKEAMSRHIHKVCNFLAPEGSIQERELAGILIPLRYSLTGFRSLFEKIDILKLEHQLISMD